MVVEMRTRSEAIRSFILKNVEEFGDDLANITAKRFNITRQAVSKHIKKIVMEGVLLEFGNTRNRFYRLAKVVDWKKTYPINSKLAEDIVWRTDVRPILGDLPDNIMSIWDYGFTEMFNNAIDHSDGSEITVIFQKNAIYSEIVIRDNGVGIFNKIQSEKGLLDKRHAILELSKGKLTTDPARHSGEGIFFTSRMFDFFNIHSSDLNFCHEFGKKEDWILEHSKNLPGTAVLLQLNNQATRTSKQVFDEYTTKEDYGFAKTVVPVKLAKYGSEQLISRSQAKRLLERVELFRMVIFDFIDVTTIGQAFADEIFRVFKQAHPEIELKYINANIDVYNMIERAYLASKHL